MIYTYDFQNVILPRNEYKLLKRFEKNNHIYLNKLNNLMQLDLICYCEYTSDEIGQQIPIGELCQITEKGLCYLQYYRSKFVDIRLPVIIASVSLILSTISFILEIIVLLCKK